MEPVTHILTGACLARTGFNRKAAYATLAMAIAAELPDIDTLWAIRGPVASFTHHRGITHTFLGVPFEAAAVVAAMYWLHRRREKKHANEKRRKPVTAAPVQWGWLYVGTLLALLSHLLLDFTNNYGIRPFLPFNPHWYAASIVFIFDPYIFATLALALVIPGIFQLVSAEITGGKQQPFRGRGWAIAALTAMVAFWTVREVQHNHAVTLAMAQTLEFTPAASQTAASETQPATAMPTQYLQPLRVAANPGPLNLFRWYTVTDYGVGYQLAEVDTRNAAYNPGQEILPKPAAGPATLAAERSPLGRAYLDWSPMPIVTLSPADADNPHAVVQFQDPRLMGDTPILRSTDRLPLTGIVELDGQNHVVAQTLDGREQR